MYFRRRRAGQRTATFGAFLYPELNRKVRKIQPEPVANWAPGNAAGFEDELRFQTEMGE